MNVESGAVCPGVGQTAPSVCLPSHFGERLSLEECRQRADAESVLAVFFPFAFSPVCGSEMQQLTQLYAQLRERGIEVVAISCDPKYTLAAWVLELDLPFVLLADFWPHGDASTAFGAFDEERGFARRLSFLIDADGVVIDTLHSPLGARRDFSRLVRDCG